MNVHSLPQKKKKYATVWSRFHFRSFYGVCHIYFLFWFLHVLLNMSQKNRDSKMDNYLLLLRN